MVQDNKTFQSADSIPNFPQTANVKNWSETASWQLVVGICIVLGGIGAALTLSDRLQAALGLREPLPSQVVQVITPVQVDVKTNLTFVGPPAPSNLIKPAFNADTLTSPKAVRSKENDRSRRANMPDETEVFTGTHLKPEDEK